jgi:hypothetical protein
VSGTTKAFLVIQEKRYQTGGMRQNRCHGRSFGQRIRKGVSYQKDDCGLGTRPSFRRGGFESPVVLLGAYLLGGAVLAGRD